MLYKFILVFLLFAFTQNSSFGQDKSGPPKKDQSMKSKRKMRKAARKKWKEDRATKRAEEKRIRDYQKRTQTKEVQKRMKRSKKIAQRNHDNKREPFFERMFKKKGKSSKKSKERAPKVKQY